MKIPMKWLKDYLRIDLPADQFASKMVMAGNGVEGVENLAEQFTNVVAGRVLSCEAHPDSDHLHVLNVDVGGDAPLQIVCGAPNVRAGGLYPAALEGARLPGGHSIKRGKIRGVESCGMLCSGPELGVPEGLYPNIGDEGLLELREDYAPGTDLLGVFGLDDEVVDFEVLANRPDCLSVWGMAREAAAVLDTPLSLPEIRVEEKGAGKFSDYATVRVLDDELCPRYCARVIDKVRIAPSPAWLRAYLHNAGVRPINNIVDITNFVMLETGHPMHAFDLSKVRDQTIVVRRARPGENLVTLDGREHLLNENMLVIADAEKATGLAGVMGGEESEILDGTARVLFECAAFDRTNIRLTSRALGLRTEASGRFERGVFPATAMQALDRACMLVGLLDCGEVVPDAFDRYANPAPRRVVRAEAPRVNRLISTQLTGEEMRDILVRLQMRVTLEGDSLFCEAPAWRGDIETEADIAEEVLRLYGYDHIPSTLMNGVTMAGGRGEKQSFLGSIRTSLVEAGFYEALSYSFVSPKWLSRLSLSEGDWRLDPVKLRNPLGEDTSVMRTSLIPSMLSTLSLNINRGNSEGTLFELAPVFKKGGELPEEKLSLCLGLWGEGVDFYRMKAAVNRLLSRLGVAMTVVAGGDPYYHPGRKALIYQRDQLLGQMGEIHPDTAEAFEIDSRRVYLCELDVEALRSAARPVPAVKLLPKFPAVSRDLALVMDEGVEIGPLMETMRRAAGRELEDIRVFDLFRGAQLGPDKKSVAFSLSFRAADRTLTEEEIAARVSKILGQASSKHGAELRK